MAINRNNSFIANGALKAYPILPAEIGLIAPGQMLVGEMLNGIMYAKRSTDGTTDIQIGIAGFGVERPGSEIVPRVATTVIDDGALVVNYGSKAESVGGSANPLIYTVAANGTRTYFTTGTAATGVANVTSLDPLTLTFHASDDGKTVFVEWNSKQTAEDVAFGQGYVPSAYYKPASDILGQVTVLTEGTITTDQYDTASIWSGSGTLRSVAGGMFAWNNDTGTPTTDFRCIILERPSATRRWLTLGVNS